MLVDMHKKPQKAESVTQRKLIALQYMYGDVLYTEVCGVVHRSVWCYVEYSVVGNSSVRFPPKSVDGFPSRPDQTRTDNNKPLHQCCNERYNCQITTETSSMRVELLFYFI